MHCTIEKNDLSSLLISSLVKEHSRRDGLMTVLGDSALNFSKSLSYVVLSELNFTTSSSNYFLVYSSLLVCYERVAYVVLNVSFSVFNKAEVSSNFFYSVFNKAEVSSNFFYSVANCPLVSP